MRASTYSVLTVGADVIGATSAALGGLLAVAPLTGGRRLGLTDTDVTSRRLLGAVDGALGLAIVAGRASRWRWSAVAARSLLHLVFAREYIRHGRRFGALAMCALFVIDAGVATGLRVVSHREGTAR